MRAVGSESFATAQSHSSDAACNPLCLVPGLTSRFGVIRPKLRANLQRYRDRPCPALHILEESLPTNGISGLLSAANCSVMDVRTRSVIVWRSVQWVSGGACIG